MNGWEWEDGIGVTDGRNKIRLGYESVRWCQVPESEGRSGRPKRRGIMTGEERGMGKETRAVVEGRKVNRRLYFDENSGPIHPCTYLTLMYTIILKLITL